MTACAPNFLAIDFIRKIAHIEHHLSAMVDGRGAIRYSAVASCCPSSAVSFIRRRSRRAQRFRFGAGKLDEMGRVSRNEIILGVLVLIAILLWVLAGDYIDATVVAFMVISTMLILGVLTWNDMARYHSALDHDRTAGDAGRDGRWAK